MKFDLKKHGKGDYPSLWILWIIVVGCLYILDDPIERFLTTYRNIEGYKEILNAAKDFTFALGAIIGGVLLLTRDEKGWLFISYFSFGFLVTIVFDMVFYGGFQRSNSFDQFFLIQLWAVVILIRFWRKLVKSPRVYVILLLVIILNLFLAFLYSNTERMGVILLKDWLVL